MTTTDLAKELDGLARQLRALSYEASASVASTLDLEQRSGGAVKPPHKFAPRELTLLAIANALGQQTRRGTARSLELRSDVYDRRVEKLAQRFAVEFERAVRIGSPAPAGITVGLAHRGLPQGVKHYREHTPGYLFDRTPISAEFAAWSRAVRRVLVQIVPSYSSHEIECFSRRGNRSDVANWSMRDRMTDKRDEWAERNALLRCKVDGDGRVVSVAGADPIQFAELLRQVQAGNSDPLGLFCGA